MNVLDLFSGIGGFSLGLERAGFKTVAFCEIEPFCRRVIERHWPGIPIYDDIRTLSSQHLSADGVGPIDAICGGFPCQDISIAGKHAGIEGDRSNLWSEYARLIGELRPRFVIVENVAALLGRGIERVLGDLAALGYDAEWHCVRACAVGLPHGRDRVWIIAYPAQERRAGAEHGPREGNISRRLRASLSTSGSHAVSSEQFRGEVRAAKFVRTANGLPNRTHRIASLGNAVIPQMPELIGRAILTENP